MRKPEFGESHDCLQQVVAELMLAAPAPVRLQVFYSYSGKYKSYSKNMHSYAKIKVRSVDI